MMFRRANRVNRAEVERDPMDDMQLLQQYAQTGSQDAFEQLVTRHIDWV